MRRRLGEAQVAIGERGRHAAALGALQVALLDEEGLEHVLDRVALLADRRGEVVDADGAAAELCLLYTSDAADE